MQKLSFCALVRFPGSSYHEFNDAIKGIATVDSITRRESEDYDAHIEFTMQSMAGCITAVSSCEGSIVEIVPNKQSAIPSAVRKYVKKANGKHHPAKKANGKKAGSRLEKLKQNLTDWRSVKELQKLIKEDGGIYARFNQLKKDKVLQMKTGPDGKKVYKLKTAAAAA